MTLDPKSSYHISYPEFLRYFEGYQVLDRHSLTIGIHFTYGWMPTVFDFRSGDIDSVIIILNKARKSAIVTVEELTLLKGFLNGSLVGTSKLLHFLAPDAFPIWDSRVYRYFYRETPHFYRMDNVEKYVEYYGTCRTIAARSDFDTAHNHVVSQLYPLSRLRSLELIMFDRGGKSFSLANGT